MEKIKIYISGKITGIEEEAPRLFEKGVEQIEHIGHIGINPMKLTHEHNKTWEAYMKEDIKALCECDGIYMLRNWTDSEGAIWEHFIAKKLKMIVLYQN